jgi:hypothetical protein
VRLRLCEPVPHDLVQVDQAVNGVCTQAVGHACVLQACVSSECGQILPPNEGGLTERLRFIEPVPHDWVQVDQAPRPEYSQSMAHGFALQLRVSARYGHT